MEEIGMIGDYFVWTCIAPGRDKILGRLSQKRVRDESVLVKIIDNKT